MKQASINYFAGTLLKTPIKAYIAGSSLHVAIQEVLLLLSLLYNSPNVQDIEVLTAMIGRAVMIYAPATDPAAFFVNCIFGVVAVGLWTVHFDQATNF